MNQGMLLEHRSRGERFRHSEETVGSVKEKAAWASLSPLLLQPLRVTFGAASLSLPWWYQA